MAGIVITPGASTSTNTPAPLSNYLGAFNSVQEIQALPNVAGSEADLLRDGETDQRWFYDTSDNSWRPYGDDAFKGYYNDLEAVKADNSNPLTTYRATNAVDKKINYVVYQGQWIEEPTSVDAAYLQFYVANQLSTIPAPQITVQDENGIDQFTAQEVKFENFIIDPATQKLTAPAGYTNTSIGGMAQFITNKFDFAAIAAFKDDQYNTISLSTEEIDQVIKNFSIDEDGVIHFYILIDYTLNGFYFNVGKDGFNCTSYIDTDGRFRGGQGQYFRGNTNIKKLVLNGWSSSQYTLCEGASSLEYFESQSITFLEGLISCTALTTLIAPAITKLTGLQNSNLAFPNEVTDDVFPNLKIIIGQDVFKGKGVTKINLTSLIEIGGNTLRSAGYQLTEFTAPNLVIVGAGSFRGCSFQVLDIPLVTEIGAGGGITTFWDFSDFRYLNIPKCKQLGSTAGSNELFRNHTLNDLIINANDFLRTNNDGDMDGDLQHAIVRGARVNFITDAPKSFENEIIDVSTTYQDDAAAAAGNIKIGQRYVNDAGDLKVRLV